MKKVVDAKSKSVFVLEMAKRMKLCKDDPMMYCEKDYQLNHCWTSLGVVERHNILCEVFKCSQCNKCIIESLEFINLIQ